MMAARALPGARGDSSEGTGMEQITATMEGGAGSGPRPFRRRVFYIPGYDPFPPRRYRELYRREGALQAEISDYALAVGPQVAGGRYGWRVTSVIEGRPSVADVEVLVWTDLVRGSMAQGILATYGQLLRTSWAYIGSGALFRLMRLRKGPMIAALYPVVMLLAQLALAGVAGWAVAGLVAFWLPFWAGAGAGLLLVAGLLRGFRAMDGKLLAYYLMHDYAYSAQLNGQNPADLEGRMSEFCKTIRAALDSDVDEVLVVGHSSGAHLGVSILSDLLRAGLPQHRAEGRAADRVPDRPALGFLSLGQVVPMVSFLPRAGRLRADLNYLSQSRDLSWVDVTAPGDGCAFALCDPVAVSGVAPANPADPQTDLQTGPLILSAAFSQTLSPERWQALRWRFFRLHFQYLCAFDRPGTYDYFRITAGPMTLKARFAGRSSSKSRIDRAVNRYTTMA